MRLGSSAAHRRVIFVSLAALAGCKADCTYDLDAAPDKSASAAASAVGGAGESCRARSDCAPGLFCIANVCRADDAPASKQIRTGKDAECSALIAVINKGIAKLEANQKKGGEAGPSDLKVMADAMDQAAKDTAAVSIATPGLLALSEKYQRMAKDVATSARDMAAAAEEKNIDKMTKAQEAMEAAAKQEDPLIDAINVICASP